VRRLLADSRVAPAGLGARDTLRLEAGLPLHGNDISPTTSPVEAGLSFAIPKSRRADGALAGGFPGAGTVLAQLGQGPSRKLVGLISPDSIPIRSHASLLDANGISVGEVTSGTVSPSLGKPIMLAYVSTGAQPVQAAVRDRRPAVQTVPLPFVPKRYKR
jgi:aminomethyltransferase